MLWKFLIVILNVLCGVFAINRPVQKIVLTQKGFAQFLQYDIETPPIRQFTICAWIKLYSLDEEQTIFTYFVKGNNRVVRLWLDTGGKNVKVSINEEVTSTTGVYLAKRVWRHVCMSFQSDYGAWAIYLDARLVSCYNSQRVQGLVLPENGSIFVGYGSSSDAKQYGFEGEIFGVNMILKSTIQRNRTLAMIPKYEQKGFRKNILKNNNDPSIEYIILKDMKPVENTALIDPYKISSVPKQSVNKAPTSSSSFEHDIGLDQILNKPQKKTFPKRKEITDFRTSSKGPEFLNIPINFWELVNDANNVPISLNKSKNLELSGSGTQELPTISDFETPPPVESVSSIKPHLDQNIGVQNLPDTESIYDATADIDTNNTRSQPHISDIETPPPINNEDNVYGQWTSGSKYGNSVLDYLKTINFRKIPSTIPLKKTLTDDYPYPSDFRITKLKPPMEFRRPYLMQKRSKRDTKTHEINVKVLGDGLRDHILNQHAKTNAKNVEIIPRGEDYKNFEPRLYRNTDMQISIENLRTLDKVEPTPFTKKNYENHRLSNNSKAINELFSTLPFLKSIEYFTEDSEYGGSKHFDSNVDMYSRSFSNNPDTWHNIKTSRKMPAVHRKMHQGSSHQFDGQKIIDSPPEEVVEGRLLASKVSVQANGQKQNLSIFKYNHGFLPGHYQERLKDNFNDTVNFEKSVKLGNVLNERFTIGNSEAEKKMSFVGGIEKIPDINRYRSDLDKHNTKVPPSLSVKECKKVGLVDRVLYVQPDNSVDVSNIFSQQKEKNEAIDFVVDNYKTCSLDDSVFQKSPMLFIDWNRTPVRLFGGAFANKTRDLCGFF